MARALRTGHETLAIRYRMTRRTMPQLDRPIIARHLAVADQHLKQAISRQRKIG
jgi:hypothetical protein